LFVKASVAQVTNYLDRQRRSHTIQWHGDKCLPGDLPNFQLIPAFAVRDKDSLLEITRYLEACRAEKRMPAAVLVDALVPGQHGGTGQKVPWDVLADFRPAVPLILAGGLTAENVAEAIRIVQPFAVDVASGVELSPGRKDPQKMLRFIRMAREAAGKYAS
jgi:phosphoribosylanthranilate isomerase